MSTRELLKAKLDEIGGISNETWFNGLSDRKRAELQFHDRDRDRKALTQIDQDTYERFYGNKKYYQATDDSKRYVDDWIKTHVPGKVFLDYACGNGVNAIKAARAGAALSLGLDISRVSVQNATEDAAAQGLSATARFIQADAEDTKLPDSSIDVIICSGMLHHLDLSYAFPELRRILAPGGKILAIEALDYNPMIKLYRKLTPDMRTEWEKAHILSLKDLRFARRFFDVQQTRYWHITSIVAPHVPFMLPALNLVDKILTRIPGVQLMSWIFTFELRSTK
ncbi:ubiquinone/menaquinone biosynthesis C-methylase UbiE [Povalibacter uvarum]|uniref:Ubiquinone/menaquinone biosynthesis C-methylase UbiE n=1 Tax=Povalibacter uvarum TaxID=732238 RepID=A0A841HHQ2_9GAMM|nr:class I SAM-dependent methyltransferase [Povalibacter uvarum]MBB6091605.1 ubiquinone/menaquinone biosynthesis C-methylase UbiE [Povalibacter uvarum]